MTLSFFQSLTELRGNIPEEWKSVIIYPIIKPLKDQNLHTSYRALLLLLAPQKLCEIVIKNRVEQFLEHHHLLPINQVDFRSDKVYLEPVARPQAFISLQFSKKKKVAAIFFDIQAA